MMRRLFSVMAVLAASHVCLSSAEAAGSEIISQPEAARHGLARPWWTQVQMDRSSSRLQNLVLHDGVLYAQTDRAMVHAIDAETGATLWSKQIGRREHPSMTPGLGDTFLAIINGSRLYVANRHNGDLLFETDIDGAPGAGPAVSNTRVYVPMVNGMLVAYRVEQLADSKNEPDKDNPPSSEKAAAEKSADRQQDIRLSQKTAPPLVCQSKGRALVQPLVTRQNADEEYVAWPTDLGYLYIGRIDHKTEYNIEIMYRLQTAAPIVARPTYLPPDPSIAGDSGIILAASGDGYVHAVLEKNGDSLWRFSTGEPLAQPAAVIDERIYAATSLGGLHCINVHKGSQFWYAPGIMQFVAASKNRAYCADKIGQLQVLDTATGAKLDLLATTSLPIKITNSDTDRIYLATQTGLIQCLHEIGLTKPILHGEERKHAAEQSATAKEPGTPALKSPPKESPPQQAEP